MHGSDHNHDHSHVTHTASCDEAVCEYEARIHAHDHDTAAQLLAQELSKHNKEEHDKETDPEEIKGAVKEKMKMEG